MVSRLGYGWPDHHLPVYMRPVAQYCPTGVDQTQENLKTTQRFVVLIYSIIQHRAAPSVFFFLQSWTLRHARFLTDVFLLSGRLAEKKKKKKSLEKEFFVAFPNGIS